ncbi:MAG: prepilin peptidase, partial [Verrucomicrobiota bacterium]
MTGFVRLYLDAVVFVFGAVIGSFLNVCIHRMPRGESIVTPPSACPHCGTHIRWYHNIPLVTYLMIRGKCRYCGVSITPRYFVVELLTAVAFLAVWLRFDGWEPVIYWIMFSGLIAATFIDVERLIIPNEITLGGIIVGVLLSLLRPIPAIEALLQSLLGSLCGGGLLWLVVEAGKMLFGKLHISLYPQSQIVIVDRKIGYDLPASTERSKFQFFCFILLTMLYRLLPVSRVLRRWFIKFTHTRFSAVRFPRRHEEVQFADVFSRDSDRIT